MGKREYQDQLIDMCYDLQPDLVVVDSLSSVNARGENNIEDMRDILFFFTEIPEAFDCGLVLIHHPRKPGKGITRSITMHDLRGTGHITAMARIIIGLDVLRDSPEENPNGPRQVKALKNNLTRYPKPLVAQFTPLPDNPDFIHITYSDMPLSVVSPETQAEQCARWLLELLQEEGPLSFGKIEAYATEENFKSGVVRAARRLLGDKIVDTKGLKERGNQWALADEEIDSDEILLSQKETLTDQCAEWLLEALQNGPLSYAKLKSLATRAGFSENVLQKGRHCLGSQIVDTMGPGVKGNRWALADYIT
jgi:hypothetical protein